MRRILSVLMLASVLTACGQPTNLLEQVKANGELVVITRNSPTTYYEGPDGPTGFEYDLASLFARRLGVELRLVVPDNFPEILPMIEARQAHFAAAGLTVTEQRKTRVRFAPSYQKITPQLIYRTGTKPPRHWSALNGHLEVVASSSHCERLEALQTQNPELEWQENAELESEQLLNLVWEQVIDYTVADSNELSMNLRFYPELRVALDLSEPEPLAWAFPIDADASLYQEARNFFAHIQRNGELKQIIDRYYGHVKKFDYVGTRAYMRHIEQRLPSYRRMFEAAAETTEQDWRLLAAMGYQESHWNPKARSPTGVRGIMMLTLNTMRHLGLTDRLDPEQSISGGARYIAQIKKRLPERIADPDRTWMALASYNVGIGHLEDARILTQKNGADPDKWVDVSKHLPLLTQKKWYKQTKHGYARGREPVRYVENIRSYYDILVWHTAENRVPEEVPSHFSFSLPAI